MKTQKLTNKMQTRINKMHYRDWETNYMNNVDRTDIENKKINVMKYLQEQGLSIQETNTIINGISSLANAIDKLK